MNKRLFPALMVCFALASCQKEEMLTGELPEPVAAMTTTANAEGAFTFKFNETNPVRWTAWNNCTGEPVEFSGTGHFRVNGVVNNNVATYSLHYNAAGIKGTGLFSGATYITTDFFNYTNNKSLTDQGIVFQQRGTMQFIAVGNPGNKFVVEDNWHLTVNANGEVTKFHSTGGDIISCE